MMMIVIMTVMMMMVMMVGIVVEVVRFIGLDRAKSRRRLVYVTS